MAIAIRRAKEEDAEAIGRILFEVHAVHHAIRPDLFWKASANMTKRK